MDVSFENNFILDIETLPIISSFAECMPEGFFIYKASGLQDIIFFNSKLSTILGCEQKSDFYTLTGGRFKGIVVEEDYEACKKSIKNQIKKNEDSIYNVTFRARKLNGSICWLDVRGYYCHSDSFGDIYYSFANDITREKDQKNIVDNLLEYNKLRADALSFISENDANIETFIEFFGDRIIEITGCDQVTYRNRDGQRLVRNAPGINVSSGDICNRCQFSNLNHPLYYKDGLVCMDDCRKGFEGVMTVKDCPAKSSVMQHIYSGNELCGLLSLHYFTNLHTFNESELEMLKSIASYLGMLLKRIDLAKAETEEIKRIIDGAVKQYSSVFVVNTTNLSYRVLKLKNKRLLQFLEEDTFSGALMKYIDTDVYYPDRRALVQATDMDMLLKNIADDDYSIIYRDISTRTPLWYKLEARKLSDTECLFAFANKDIEILTDKLNVKRSEDYFAVYYVDLDFELIKIIKCSPWYVVGEQGTVKPYREALSHFASIFNDDTRDFFKQFSNPDFIRRIFEREDKYTVTYKSTNISDEGKWVQMTGYVISRHEDGSPQAFTLGFSLADSLFSEKMELQNQLGEALAMAQAANIAKTVFLNNMSHDIRTPMNAIVGYVGLAASHIDEKEKVKDYLQKISKSSDHLLELINNVLDMSRIESGKVKLEENEENLLDIITSIADIIRAEADSKGTGFSVDVSSIRHVNVICDKLRLNQLLLNLASNAIKYSGDRGEVSLSVRESCEIECGYSMYEFIVVDNGIGMSEEFLKTVFEPFSRASTTTASGIQGTGLGMAISKNIVDMMGGSIDIESKEHEGTKVSVILRFKLADNSEVEEKKRINKNAPASPNMYSQKAEPSKMMENRTNNLSKSVKGKRVLLVEDNELNTEIASMILTELGLEVETVNDGTVAVEKVRGAKKGQYDLILMDIQMPLMNGYEATARIRAMESEPARVPIVAMTANAFAEDKRKALDVGMNDHISKPFKVEDLKEILVKYLT